MPDRELLAGKTVLVTRPVAQARDMLASLERHQATVVHFPAIRICVAEDTGPAENLLQHLADYDAVIFSSANAVHHAMQLVRTLQLTFSARCIAAVGPATRAALKHHRLQADIVPGTGFSSEDLLAHEGLQAHAGSQGQHILIIRGVGGREHLARELRARGARVDIAEVYQRLRPTTRPARNLGAHDEKNSAVLAYSAESMQNLWALCTGDEQKWLGKVTLIAGSRRIAMTATAMGFTKNPIIAENASDAAMLEAVLAWARGQH